MSCIKTSGFNNNSKKTWKVILPFYSEDFHGFSNEVRGNLESISQLMKISVGYLFYVTESSYTDKHV